LACKLDSSETTELAALVGLGSHCSTTFRLLLTKSRSSSRFSLMAFQSNKNPSLSGSQFATSPSATPAESSTQEIASTALWMVSMMPT
jgi:hypothetical protein